MSASHPPEQLQGSVRQLSLSDRFVFTFNTAASVYKNAVALGDIDNDPHGDVELAIGNVNGELAIFKGKQRKPWRKCADLGTITCMTVGDLYNSGKNSLVVASAEGYCYVFDIDSSLGEAQDNNPRTRMSSALKVSAESIGQKLLRAGNAQRNSVSDETLPILIATPTQPDSESLPQQISTASKTAPTPNTSDSPILDSPKGQVSHLANSKQARADDQWRRGSKSTTPTPQEPSILDYIGTTDGGLSAPGVENSPLDAPVKSASREKGLIHTFYPYPRTEKLATQSSADTGASPNKLKKRAAALVPSIKAFIPPNANCLLIADIDSDGQNELIVGSSDRALYCYGIVLGSTDGKDLIGKLRLKHQWSIVGQANSLDVSKDKMGRPVLIVGMQGNTYGMINYKGELVYKQFGGGKKGKHKDERSGPTELRFVTRPSVTIDGNPQTPTLISMATLDGWLKLEDESSQLLWEYPLEHQLISLASFDVTRNGEEEMVACSWDGTTFVVDQYQNVLKLRFEDRVQAFAAGYFSPFPGQRCPVLVYVTFKDEICIYSLHEIDSVACHSLVSLLRPEIERSDLAQFHTRDEYKQIIWTILSDSLDENEMEKHLQSLLLQIAELRQRDKDVK